jgi:hypothetical protein
MTMNGMRYTIAVLDLVVLINGFAVDIDRPTCDSSAVVFRLSIAKLGAENLKEGNILPAKFGPGVICLLLDRKEGEYVVIWRDSSIWTVYDPVFLFEEVCIAIFGFDEAGFVGCFSASFAGGFFG